MRCEECGRQIRNAEMWRLSDGKSAPPPRSMRTVCRLCRKAPTKVMPAQPARGVLAQAIEILERCGFSAP
jgi:hypothetical protein